MTQGELIPPRREYQALDPRKDVLLDPKTQKQVTEEERQQGWWAGLPVWKGF